MCQSRQNIGSGHVPGCVGDGPSLYPVLVLQLPSILQGAGSPLQPWQTHTFFLQVDSPGDVSQQAEHWQWPSLVVAFITVGLVTWLGSNIFCPSGRHGLDSLDLRLGEPQSWRQGLLGVAAFFDVPVSDS